MRIKSIAGCLVMFVALAGPVAAQSLSLDHVDGLYAPDTIPVGQQVTFYIRLTGDDSLHRGIGNGFKIYSPDGIQWGSTIPDTLPLGWSQWFSLNFVVSGHSLDGFGVDSVAFTGSYNPPFSQGLPRYFDSASYSITIGPIDPTYRGKRIALDSCTVAPGVRWFWAAADVIPSWDGPHVFRIVDPEYLPTATFQPRTMHAFEVNAISPIPGSVRFGNIYGEHIMDRIDLSSVRVAGDIVPEQIDLLPSAPGFVGKVVSLSYDVPTLIRRYLPFYDTLRVPVAVGGEYTDGQSFLLTDSLTLVGHLHGDINRDGVIDVTDLIQLVDYFFAGNQELEDSGVADMNSDGRIDIGDLTSLVERFLNQ